MKNNYPFTQHLLSDKYWVNPVPLSSLEEPNTFDRIRDTAPRVIASRIGDLYRQMTMGYEVEQLPNGDKLPTYDLHLPYLLKVVEDQIEIEPKALFGTTSRREDEDTFNLMAADMELQPLYGSGWAGFTGRSSENSPESRIRRRVMYLLSSRSKKSLYAVQSTHVNNDRPRYFELSPDTVIGQVYTKNAHERKMKKIASAVVLKSTTAGPRTNRRGARSIP